MMDNITSTTPATPDISEAQLVIIRTMVTICSILGTFGNSLTIFAIVKGKLYKTPSFVFILSLSSCNFINSVVFYPLLCAQAFRGIWTHNMALCIAYSYGIYCSLGTELWGYICITFNRYFCVVHHNLYNRVYGNKKVIAAMVIFSWTFYPIFFLFPLTEAWGDFKYSPKKLVCYPFHERNCDGFCLLLLLVSVFTSAPVITLCYGSIIYKYVQSRKKVGVARRSTVSNPNQLAVPTETRTRTNKTSEKQRHLSELKMAFTILAVILVFAVFRVPFMILYMYDPTMVKVKPIVHTTLIYIGVQSDWINPLIYAFTNKQINHTLRRTFFSATSRIAPKTSWNQHEGHTSNTQAPVTRSERSDTK